MAHPNHSPKPAMDKQLLLVFRCMYCGRIAMHDVFSNKRRHMEVLPEQTVRSSDLTDAFSGLTGSQRKGTVRTVKAPRTRG